MLSNLTRYIDVCPRLSSSMCSELAEMMTRAYSDSKSWYEVYFKKFVVIKSEESLIYETKQENQLQYLIPNSH